MKIFCLQSNRVSNQGLAVQQPFKYYRIKAMDKNEVMALILLHFSWAFYTVNHTVLLVLLKLIALDHISLSLFYPGIVGQLKLSILCPKSD